MLPSEKILISGSCYERHWGQTSAIARLLPNGSHDPSFGDAGELLVDPSSYGICMSMLVQPDGRIVLGGSKRLSYPASAFGILRLDLLGNLDNTFGDNGIVTTNISDRDEGSALALQPDGKILLAGSSPSVSGSVIVVARYLPNSIFDPKPEIVKFSPNPSNGIFQLDIKTSDAQLSIYSVLGQEVCRRRLLAGYQQLDLGFLPDGVYHYILLGEAVHKGTLVILH